MAADFFAELSAASFRGVAFEVPEDHSAFGRRVVTHEYPGADVPFHEDLGLSVQSFTIEAIVHGADFLARAAALEAALKSKGPGRLVHPTLGEIEVVVRSASRRHSTASAGEVSFSVSFEKHGAARQPFAARDTAAALWGAARGGFSAIQSDFIARYIPGLADYLTADASARAGERVTLLRSALKDRGILRFLGDAALSPVFDVADAAVFAGSAVALFSGLPPALAPARKSPLGTASPAARIPPRASLSLMAAMSDHAGRSLSVSAAGSAAARAARQTNAAAIDHLFRFSALAALADAARHGAYESREEAISVRTDAAARIEFLREQLGANGWDASWRAAGDILAALSRDINERIGRLPRTARIRTAGARPSLALAHRLYGDDPSRLFSRAADIVARNRIRHPGHIPASELEVLIDAV